MVEKVWGVAAVLLGSGAGVAGGQVNPIGATIPQTPWKVVLEEVVTIPNSLGTFPRLEELT